MPRFPAEEDDADDVREFLDAYEGLDHLRVRRRLDLLTLESGPQNDPIPHARLRRLSAQKWTLECATHTGRWEKTGFDGTVKKLLNLLLSTLPWIVTPRE